MITRVSVLNDLVYTLAVRQKHRFKPSGFGWQKKKSTAVADLAAMQILLKQMTAPEQTDEMADTTVLYVKSLCPLLLKEPEFGGDFEGKFRRNYMAAAPKTELTEDEKKLIDLASAVIVRCLKLLNGRKSEEPATKQEVFRYLQGLDNVVRPLLPEDDRFRVSPEKGWEFAKEWMEPTFTLTLSADVPAEGTTETPAE